jgi:23S rRNA (uracil1939-C5)-methyltransferase
MVNCDVASGSRDGDILQSLGYRLKTLRALDLFPYTGHVEAMSLWVR